MKNITLKKLLLNEENKVIDLILSDNKLEDTFGGMHNTLSRLVNSWYTCHILLDDVVIGFAMIVHNPKTEVNEVDMGILSKYRNKGYGTIALGKLKDIIVKNNLEVEVQVKKENISAIRTVLLNGFKKTREDETCNFYKIKKLEK